MTAKLRCPTEQGWSKHDTRQCDVKVRKMMMFQFGTRCAPQFTMRVDLATDYLKTWTGRALQQDSVSLAVLFRSIQPGGSPCSVVCRIGCGLWVRSHSLDQFETSQSQQAVAHAEFGEGLWTKPQRGCREFLLNTHQAHTMLSRQVPSATYSSSTSVRLQSHTKHFRISR